MIVLYHNAIMPQANIMMMMFMDRMPVKALLKTPRTAKICRTRFKVQLQAIMFASPLTNGF